MRYRFKGVVRSSGQPVEGHAHGSTPEEAFNALSEHGIVTESLREEPEKTADPNAAASPLQTALESALDIASQQVAFDALADKYKGKSVWVLDREKIRRRVAQVVDNALKDAMSDSKVGMPGMNGVREQVAEAISGLFKDNRNLTSQVSSTTNQLDSQIKRIESMVKRAEGVLAQMTLAISKMGSMNFSGGGGSAPRRYAGGSAPRDNEQNAVLVEIFKENLRLRGIEIDEPAAVAVAAEGEAQTQAQDASSDQEESTQSQEEARPQRPESPEPIAAESSEQAESSPLKQWTTNL